MPTPDEVQALKNPVEIVAVDPLAATVEVNCATVQLETMLPEPGDVNPIEAESSECSEATGLKVTADAAAGNTNAQTAIAPAKSKTPF